MKHTSHKKINIIALVMMLMFIFVLCSCGKKSSDSSSKSDSSSESASDSSGPAEESSSENNLPESQTGLPTREEILKEAPEVYDYSVLVSINPAFIL